MSMVYCEDCGRQIDTDFDVEHFDTPHLDESGDIALSEVEKVRIAKKFFRNWDEIVIWMLMGKKP